MKAFHSDEMEGCSGIMIAIAALILVLSAEVQAGDEPHPPQQGAGPEHAPHWTHNDQMDWGKEYPLCDGKNMRQSPIDILLDDVKVAPAYSLQFIDYDQNLNFSMKNTHHSVSVKPAPSDSPPTLRINWMAEGDTDFELQEIHFHWGDGLNKGSEHMINGERAAAEMHMVHYKKGVKSEDIGNVENSLVVIGVFIESDTMAHNKLEGLVSDVALVNGTDEERVAPDSSTMLDLLPDNHQSFYTYEGSLTTPPCYEVVTWILLSSPVYMSNDKLIELTNLEAAGQGTTYKINANHRDVQPLLNRHVFASFNVSESISSGRKTISDETFHSYFGEYWRELTSLKDTLRIMLRNLI